MLREIGTQGIVTKRHNNSFLCHMIESFLYVILGVILFAYDMRNSVCVHYSVSA